MHTADLILRCRILTMVLTLWVLTCIQPARGKQYGWGSAVIQRSRMDQTKSGFMMIPNPPSPSVVNTRLTGISFFCHATRVPVWGVQVDILILKPGPAGTYRITRHTNTTIPGPSCRNSVVNRSISLDMVDGDVLGLGFNGVNPIPYDDYGRQALCVRQLHMGYVKPTHGRVIAFTRDSQCRVYSVMAFYTVNGWHPRTPHPPVSQYPIRPSHVTTTTTTRYRTANGDPNFSSTSGSGSLTGYVVGCVILCVIVIGIVVFRAVWRQRAMRQMELPLEPGTPMQRPQMASGPRPYPTQDPGSYPSQHVPYYVHSAYPPYPNYSPEAAAPAYNQFVEQPTISSNSSIDPSCAPPPPYDSVVKDQYVVMANPRDNFTVDPASVTPAAQPHPSNTADGGGVGETAPQEPPPPQYEDVFR